MRRKTDKTPPGHQKPPLRPSRRQTVTEAPPERRFPPIRSLFLDFDGTLTRDHLLPCWSCHLMTRAELPFRLRAALCFRIFSRGPLSMLLASAGKTAETAVRTAFAAFRHVDAAAVDDFIRTASPKGFRIRHNPQIFPILKAVMAYTVPRPAITICSQGAFPRAVRGFLQRTEVRDNFRAVGISTETIRIMANEPETDEAGRFTGRLKPPIVTKYTRPARMPRHALFIGDDGDERVCRVPGMRHRLRFINWHRAACHSDSFLADAVRDACLSSPPDERSAH